MSLDSTNKQEQEMRKKVSQYEAPFDPGDWKAMKAKLAKQTAQPDPEQGLGSSDLLPPPSTSIFLKSIISIGSIITISTALWLGTSFFSETNPSSSAVESNTEASIESTTILEKQKEENTIDLEKDLSQEKEATGDITELGLLPGTTSATEQNINNTSVTDPLSSEKQKTQKSISSIEGSSNIENAKNKIVQERDKTTLNVGGAQKTMNPFSSSSTSRKIEGISNDAKSSNVASKTTGSTIDQTTSQEEDNKSQERPKSETNQNGVNSNKGTADPKTPPVASSTVQETVDKNTPDGALASSATNATNRLAVGLELLDLLELPASISDTTAQLDSLELSPSAYHPDPIGPTKFKRFSFGGLVGTSYSIFEPSSGIAPWPSVLGLTSSYRLTNTLEAHLGLTLRLPFNNTGNSKHMESYKIPLENGTEIDWIYERSISSLIIFDTPLSISYRPNSLNPFVRKLRFHVGLRPSIFVPVLSEKQTDITIGTLSSKPPENWTAPPKYAGLKKADLGFLLGLDFFMTEYLYLNFNANVNNRDLTDEGFWNINPQINKNTDFQLSLRWNFKTF